jgi:hypothetical protein
MDKGTFYRNLISALQQLDFRLGARDLSNVDTSTDLDLVSVAIRAAVQLASPGIIHSSFDQERVKQRLSKVSEWAAVVGLKYAFAQPVIVAAVDADRLQPDEMINLAKRFDEVVVEMRDVTARVAGFHLLSGPRLSVTGVVLFVFFDRALAANFREHTQRKCKIYRFFKKTWVLPWVVDVSNETVNSHPGLPFLSGVLSRAQLQKKIFQRSAV